MKERKKLYDKVKEKRKKDRQKERLIKERKKEKKEKLNRQGIDSDPSLWTQQGGSCLQKSQLVSLNNEAFSEHLLQNLQQISKATCEKET